MTILRRTRLFDRTPIKPNCYYASILHALDAFRERCPVIATDDVLALRNSEEIGIRGAGDMH
jgi:hypothetical protein